MLQGIYFEMTAGCSIAALRTRNKLYKVLHPCTDRCETQEEEAKRKYSERGKTAELLVQADPSIAYPLIARYIHCNATITDTRDLTIKLDTDTNTVDNQKASNPLDLRLD